MNFAQARRTMVDCQIRPADVTDHRIIEAFLAVPRERCVPEERRDLAYADEDAVYPEGQVVLAPRTFAKMLQAASIHRDEIVLDIGCASGYSAAVLSRLADAVVALESSSVLAEQATETLADIGVENCAVLTHTLPNGAPEHQPYDVILVNGGIETLPNGLRAQLKEGGRLVILRVQAGHGECRVITRFGNAYGEVSAFDATAPVLPGFRAEPKFLF